MVKLEDDDFEMLVVCALRYCHGRQTYMPSVIQCIVGQHLHELDSKTLKILLDDRRYQEQFLLFGDEKIDKPTWLNFYDKVEKELVKRGL